MAYYNFGYDVPPGGSAFGGFPGGLTQSPGGIMPPPPSSLIDLSQPRFFGDDLPSVDPFNYPGVIHFGPSYTILGPHLPDIPPGAGIYNPNLVVPGVPSINYAFPNFFAPM